MNVQAICGRYRIIHIEKKTVQRFQKFRAGLLIIGFQNRYLLRAKIPKIVVAKGKTGGVVNDHIFIVVDVAAALDVYTNVNRPHCLLIALGCVHQIFEG